MPKLLTFGLLVLFLTVASSVNANDSAKEQKLVELPEWLSQRITSLPVKKRRFLQTEDAETFAGSREKLLIVLEKKSTAEIAAYIDAVQSSLSQLTYNEGVDLAAIPLNTDAPWFNWWKVMRPKDVEPERQAGPFNVSRYAYPKSGIATFGGFPVALYPEDLLAGKVEVAFVGVPLDMGSYHRGQKFGPMAMRNEEGIGAIDMATMVDPSKELIAVDYGDIGVDNMSTEISVRHVRERIAEIAQTGAIPFIIGGDHSLEYPDVAGLADVHGKGSFGVIHFDSHYDAGKGGAHFITHGQPVYRLIKEGHIPGKNFIQVGLRGGWPGEDGFKWMRNNGMRYHTMAEVEKRGWPAVMKDALREARENTEKLFISFDVDVLDPAFIPGTGTPVPGGLTMREAVPIVRYLCAENDIIGFELVELAPNLDPTYRSAMNANYIVNACLTGLALRKKGIVEEGYFSPLTTEHRQPEAGLQGKEQEKSEDIDRNYATGEPIQQLVDKKSKKDNGRD
ncbi:arginase [Thalassotalea mangrovi]|uniref:Arginase n=1 Tax=Thalassotalea mangrovi TaxID=2572245 RepID=A0A4U1B5A2_9GAMM|nr:arginase [Thalassotalea mangrovi]